MVAIRSSRRDRPACERDSGYWQVKSAAYILRMDATECAPRSVWPPPRPDERTNSNLKPLPHSLAHALRHCLLALALVAVVPAPAANAAGGQPQLDQDELPDRIRTILDGYRIAPEDISILVQGRGEAEPRLAHNVETERNPASVMKLFTTYAALEALGPGHTWETRIIADGRVRDGVLHGDLWLIGEGDPLLTAEQFWRMLGSLHRRGIERITGDLVLDHSRFADVERDPGEFDNRPYRAYNQPPHALLVNFNAIKFEFETLDDDSTIRVSTHPPLPNLPIDNRMRPNPESWCSAYRWHINFDIAEAGNPQTTAILDGNYGTDCGVGRLLRTAMPVEQYVHGLFSALWRHWGGDFRGGWRSDVWDDPDTEPLVSHESKPLTEVVQGINKFSNNVMTRQLALSLAAEGMSGNVSEVSGRAAVREVLRDRGLDTTGMVLDEVAGLSRDNRVTARHVADLLELAGNSMYTPEFMASLPIAGVDGTLRKRLTDRPEAGNVRMKTGMINDVSAIAGYVRNAANEDLIVVILINSPGVHRAGGRAAQDEIIRWVYRETGG